MHDTFLRAPKRTTVETVVRFELWLLFVAAVAAAAAAAARGGMWFALLGPICLLLAGLARLAAKRPLRAWVNAATTAPLTVALGLMLLLGILPHLGLYRPLTVLSGSMRPTFAPGDMIFVTPERRRDVRVGQVITYKVPVDDHHVESHRVIRILKGGDAPVVITKGDGNRIPDPWRAELHGNVVWVERLHVPFLGRLVLWFRSPLFHTLTVFVLPLLLAGYGLLRIWRTPAKPTDVHAPKSAYPPRRPLGGSSRGRGLRGAVRRRVVPDVHVVAVRDLRVGNARDAQRSRRRLGNMREERLVPDESQLVGGRQREELQGVPRDDDRRPVHADRHHERHDVYRQRAAGRPAGAHVERDVLLRGQRRGRWLDERKLQRSKPPLAQSGQLRLDLIHQRPLRLRGRPAPRLRSTCRRDRM